MSDQSLFSGSMHFWIKIVVATIVILLSTLLLNSILSISSFEKIYTRSLITTMETAGAHLAQKINRGVRLGKPLPAFEGMDELLEHFLETNQTLESVAISDTQGQILYFKSKDRVDSELFLQHGQVYATTAETFTQRYDGHYILHIPLYRPDGTQIGVVLGRFSRQVIVEQVKTMAIGALNRLAWSVGFTSVGLIVLLLVLVIRPIQKDLERIGHSLAAYRPLADGTAAAQPASLMPAQFEFVSDTPKISNDIMNIGIFLQRVAIDVHSKANRLQSVEYTLAELNTAKHDLLLYNTMLQTWLDQPELPTDITAALSELMMQNQDTIALLDQLPTLANTDEQVKQ